MADDEAPAPCPTCGTPIEPEYAERLGEQQAVRRQALTDIREAFDVWRLAPNTGDMNMALCAALSQTFNTLASAGVGTPVRPPMQCCIDGDHSFSWRQGIEPCRYCGAPVPVAAGTSAPVDVEATLHPTGRCTCGGEGRCPWCLSHCDHCGAGKR